MKWTHYLADHSGICLPIERIEEVSSSHLNNYRKVKAKIIINNYDSPSPLPNDKAYLYDIQNDLISICHMKLDYAEMDDSLRFTYIVELVYLEDKVKEEIPPVLIGWIRDLKLEKLGI